MTYTLTQEQIAKTSSSYLQHGRKEESWAIENIEINDNGLLATIQMTQVHITDTDSHGFHLTIFSTLEFVSQLMIVYMHDWSGLTEKVREGWMVESACKCKGSIRSRTIQVKMSVKRAKKVGENLYCHAVYEVSGNNENDGMFIAELKGFLS